MKKGFSDGLLSRFNTLDTQSPVECVPLNSKAVRVPSNRSKAPENGSFTK